MAAVPLLWHRSPAAALAWRDGRAVSAQRFLDDVAALARRLPAAAQVLNACTDRYRFAVAFAACLVDGRTTFLPSTRTPEVIGQLAALAPDVICLTDDPDCTIALPRILCSDADAPADGSWQVPMIDADRTAAIVFTSGSTGRPLPHRKSWGRLCACVRAGAERLGLDDGRRYSLIGTVPPQHMYGFESTVLLPLLSANVLAAAHPFYPADIAAALAATPAPRGLISTPVHLRALLAADIDLPPLELIVSATAPLAPELALAVERRFGARLLEIYGSTETGQIATRRTAVGETFQLLPGVSLGDSGDGAFAEGGHLERRTPLGDLVEVSGAREFRLIGRSADLVNIAGKRNSFAYLNQLLNSIPGVVDGVFFQGDEPAAGATGVARLAAAAVAPTLDAPTLLERLRERVDPVFLPRPLILVDRLPRNSTGKLPRSALLALAAGSGSSLEIPADHPSYPGHFPGTPLLPGVVLLDAALHRLERMGRIDPGHCEIASFKFSNPVRPGDELALAVTATEDGSTRIKLCSGSRAVASGVVRAAPRRGAAGR
ncbi:MAG: acyl-CoA synthetase [Gammaproteobacteria bacterium]|nr:acyl-CoA synthetase [Gammaproteobacteria bacterium]